MKNIKKIATIVVAFALVLSIAIVPASAAKEDVYTISIENTATLGTIENTAIDTTDTTDDVHVCAIKKANQSRHIVDCDECGKYEYVHHDAENLEASAKNEFFHEFECDCGYAYSETHSFATAYDAEGHQEICVDCGYAKEKANHVFVDEYYGDYHDITCLDCGYMYAHHVGVTFETVDNANCFASCKQCGNSSHCAHDFYGFTCDNCEFVLGGITYAIVEDIREYEDGTYRVRFMSNGNTHRVNMENVDGFNEGDFVKLDHYGDVIFDIDVIIDGDIIYDEENFINYLSADIAENFKDLSFEDLIVEEIFVNSDHIVIHSESGRRAFGIYGNYVVYDLCNIEMFEIQTDFAYINYTVNDTVYLVCFW